MTYGQSMVNSKDLLTLTDAGLETVLLFEEGVELPCFAAFPLLDSDGGRAVLRRYYEPFLRLARDRGAGGSVGSCRVEDLCRAKSAQAWRADCNQ